MCWGSNVPVSIKRNLKKLKLPLISYSLIHFTLARCVLKNYILHHRSKENFKYERITKVPLYIYIITNNRSKWHIISFLSSINTILSLKNHSPQSQPQIKKKQKLLIKIDFFALICVLAWLSSYWNFTQVSPWNQQETLIFF